MDFNNSLINPADIESIDILKDASITEIDFKSSLKSFTSISKIKLPLRSGSDLANALLIFIPALLLISKLIIFKP